MNWWHVTHSVRKHSLQISAIDVRCYIMDSHQWCVRAGGCRSVRVCTALDKDPTCELAKIGSAAANGSQRATITSTGTTTSSTPMISCRSQILDRLMPVCRRCAKCAGPATGTCPEPI